MAADFLQRAVKSDPGAVRARGNLAAVLAALGDRTGAAEALHAAAALDPAMYAHAAAQFPIASGASGDGIEL